MTHFIEQALVFIGSTLLLVPLFHRLGFGAVLGYLIAGILVGPYCLKFIHETESVVHFAELGVVLLLFVIGLEIQPRKLWSMKKDLIGLGGSQVIICSLVFMGIALLMNQSLMASIIIGFSLSLSSTAFALQTLMDKNQLNTEFGKSSFSILLMQDLMAIPALAIIPSLAETSGGSSSGLKTFLYFVVILIALITMSRYLFRPLFRIMASTHSREIFTATTLFIVLGVAALMLEIGLSAALGTFIAGVLLADSEYRHELEANLEPFKSLLMGLFFIGVGMEVSLDIVLSKPLYIFGMAISYLTLKILLLYALGRISKMTHESAKLMSLNIGQGGEFAFVIFAMALSLKLAPESILAELTAMITISMALSPLIVIADEKMTMRKNKNAPKPVYDSIKDENPQVIIAGFGRFGQIFGRILRTQGIPFVAIDHDSDQVELVRKFGNKVYYGDASRSDILHAAGAKNAKYFILAIDDTELSIKTVRTIKENYPHLKIFARARNRGHYFDLLDHGIDHIKRETFDSSSNFVEELLIDMGFEKTRAKSMIERFKVHDELMIKEQYKVRHDEKSFISAAHQSTAQLAEVLANDDTRTYIAPIVTQ